MKKPALRVHRQPYEFHECESHAALNAKKFLSRPTMTDELELHRIDCLASHGNLDNYYFNELPRSKLRGI